MEGGLQTCLTSLKPLPPTQSCEALGHITADSRFGKLGAKEVCIPSSWELKQKNKSEITEATKSIG